MRFNFNVEKIIKDWRVDRQAYGMYYYNEFKQIEIQSKQHSYSVSASVGDYYHYRCSFEVTENGRLSNCRCTCGRAKNGKACPHIGATLYYMSGHEFEKFPFSLEEERRLEQLRQEEIRRQKEEEARKNRIMNMQKELSSFIQHNKNDYIDKATYQINDEQMLEIEPVLERYEEVLSMSFRIGTKAKKYVVKNMAELVDRFGKKEITQYGKNFYLEHDINRFDEDSKKHVEFIKSTYNLPVYNQFGQVTYTPAKRDLSLSGSRPGAISRFVEYYLDKKYDTFHLKTSDEKISLILNEDDLGYTIQLALNENNNYVIVNGDMLVYPKTELRYFHEIHYVNLSGIGQPDKFIHSLLHSQDYTLHLAKEDWTSFLKYVIQPNEHLFELKGNIPTIENLMEYEKIEFYGDVDENGTVFGYVDYIKKDGTIIKAFGNDHLDSRQEVVETIIRQHAQSIQDGIVIFDIDKESTIDFFISGINRLQKYCDIYVSEALKRLNKSHKYTISVGVRVENDLLALDISSLEIPKEEIGSLLSSYRRKKKFYRLRNGEMVNLASEQLESLNQFVEDYHIDLKSLDQDEIKINKYRMFELEEDAKNNKDILISKSDSYREIIDRFQKISVADINIPDQYQTVLRPYQKEGYRWLRTMHEYGFNGILADDMGLGKTLQVIAFLEGLETMTPSIVVCPASLIYNWEDEVHKFSNKLKVACVVGTKAQRKAIIDAYNQYDLLVTSYDYMRRDYTMYEDAHFEYVILDEAQNIKNQKTKNASSVKTLKSNHRLALTGTPIENTLAELWSIFDFLMPDYLYNYHYFKTNYETNIVKNGDEAVSKKLKRLVSPFILRRTKKAVLTELPDKIEKEQIIPFEQDENKLYLANLASANAKLQDVLKMEHVDKIMILSLLTRLRQLCIEPRMLYENIDTPSSKMNALFELLESFKETHEKVLVFSAFPSVFDLIENDLKQRNISYLKLTGKTSKEDRREMIDTFQKGEIDVFLISLKAGGTGLNLTEASVVIHIDPWWNLSAQNQATDRAHRFGQKKNVQVYRLVMKNSIEEKILKLQEKKKELADLFVENNEGSIASMSKSEIVELFRD